MYEKRHQAFQRFASKILNLCSGYSRSDLEEFRHMSAHRMQVLTPLIDEYAKLAERTQTNVQLIDEDAGQLPISNKKHLFDLLRDKRLFPTNSELSDFASRILPDMKSHRFDKMSRGDIAARIIEFLEMKDKRTRLRLESSMRAALRKSPERTSRDKRSFFSEWENIIKGIEL